MTIANSTRARDIEYYIHPQTNLQAHEQNGPMVISRGDGIYVYDDNNREYIEGAAGLWCASLGFSNERLAKVAYDQIRKLGFYHSYRSHSHEAAIDLAEKLIQIAPVPMSKVLLQCSGSEANDTAIKLVWYYHHAIGKPEKRKIISRMGAYHGSTAVSISASGKPEMHADFGLPFPQFRHTENPHYYRRHNEGESEEAFATRMADALEAMILEEGPETVAAFFAEPVMGAGGAILPPKTYFEKVQAILKKYDILFVADEVICGFGRTGNMWGSQTYNLQPDIISCAKALSAAIQPISALLINEKVYKAMLAQSGKLGSFAHGYTYTGHPVAAAVALEVLKIYDEIDIVQHVKRVGAHFQKGLAKLADHPLVGDARGVGLIAGLDLVSNKKTREPLQGASRIQDQAKANGLILRFIGNRVAFSPPLIITEEQVDEMLARLKKTLDKAHSELRTH
ncbi:MAG: aminotransferase class III-fold pyridoxal phosphate-dependent enzyme [Rhizobiales bacterium]|nr:aminotransferase class III-fold pyridoxal phosphate-dependent enzyme [Hyphomicrobiales bacterium]